MKRILTLLLSICITFFFAITTMATDTKTFTDVDPATDVGKDIQKLFDAGIINGNGDGTFAPQNPVTRAELCKMVNNLKGYKVPAEVGFTDVTPDKWYYTHVLIGKQAGYINGFPNGTFRGDEYITREQVCAIICRAFGIYDLGISAGVTDAVSDWALPYVNALITNKLIKIEEGNTFRATESMKRGELATSLSNFVVSTPPAVTPGGGGSSNTGGGSSNTGGGSENTGGGSENTGGGSENTGGGSENTGGGSENTGGDSENTGGDSGNTGGNSENTGGGSGNTGGGSENTGGSTQPEQPEEMTREEIIAANSEVVEYLKNVKRGLENSRGTDISDDFTGRQYDIVVIVYECVKGAIETGEAGDKLISRDYVYEQYASDIEEAKAIYSKMSDNAKASFRENIVQNIPDTDTQQFLIDMFL